MNSDLASNGDAYDPERFVRGGVAEADGKGKAVRWSTKGQVFGIRLTLETGKVAMPYCFLRSLPWINLAATCIELIVEGYHRDEEGWRLGDWLVTITGKRLTLIHDQINAGKLEWVQPAKDERAEYPEVDGVTVEWFEEKNR